MSSDLTSRMAFKTQLQANISTLELSLNAERKKVTDAEFYIAHPGKYDEAALQREIDGGKVNIESIEGVLTAERKRLAECSAFIDGNEGILMQHDPHLVCHFRGESAGNGPVHTWVTDSTFDFGPNRGHWKTRHCSVCTTSERLG